MNLFYLDSDPALAVTHHNDQHVRKMPLETAQILCTALWNHGIEAPYRPTHAKHPTVLWCGENVAQWRWARGFAALLFDEYRYRFNKNHASLKVLNTLPQAPNLPGGDWTPPPQAMPDQYKDSDPVIAYRRFYQAEKALFPGKGPATWTRRPVPGFMQDVMDGIWSDLERKSA